VNRALCLLAVLFTGVSASADEPAAEERVFIKLTVDKDAYFVGEPVPLRLRIGFDRAYFETNGVALFRQEMDVPLQVRASWLKALDGATAVPAPASDEPGETVRLVLNDDVAALRRLADEERDGRTFAVLEHVVSYEPARVGDLIVGAPSLRFAFATKFREDFINGRTALDRRDVTVLGEALTVRIKALPEDGRPEAFPGALGQFTVRAEADRMAVESGDVIKLTLTIEGQGNIASFDRPRLDQLEGFHELGAIDEKTMSGRRITYDIAPTGIDVEQIPAIAFAYFDPKPPAQYRVVRTKPIPITVTRPRFELPKPEADKQDESEPEDAAIWVWALALFFVLLVALVLRGRATDDTGESDGVDRGRIKAATEALHAELSQPTSQLSGTFAEFLAAHLRCERAAVIGPSLAERLAATGVPAEDAERAAKTLEQLVAARYGGGAPGELDAGLIDALELAFHR